MAKYCSKCGAKLDDSDEFCCECGEKINKTQDNHLTINKKIIYIFIAIVIIAILGIFAYGSITNTNVVSEIVDSANSDKVWVDTWNNDFWDDEDKILYVTFTPTKDIDNSGGSEVAFDELIVTYSDGSSEKVSSIVGEWCRDKILHKGESYTTGIGFESDGKEVTHVSGKLAIYHETGNDDLDYEKEIILHFDNDV